LVLAFVVAALLAAAGLAPSAVAKDKQKRPDLEITRAVASGREWVSPGIVADLSFQDVTKNTGKAAAGPSVTAYYLHPLFAGPRPTRYRVKSRTVERLGPGDADPGVTSASVETNDLPLGAYALEICADADRKVKEESNDNNCKRTGKEFYVVKGSWQGSIDGVGSTAGMADVEQWHSQGAELFLIEHEGKGVFRYGFSGTVGWTDFGVNIHACKWTGSGSKALDQTNSGPGIKLNYGAGKYKGTVAVDARFYTITISSDFQPPEICGGTTQGPLYTDFLTIPARDLSFNQNELKGRYVDRVFNATWKWDFR
jgi:CARDB